MYLCGFWFTFSHTVFYPAKTCQSYGRLNKPQTDTSGDWFYFILGVPVAVSKGPTGQKEEPLNPCVFQSHCILKDMFGSSGFLLMAHLLMS